MVCLHRRAIDRRHGCVKLSALIGPPFVLPIVLIKVVLIVIHKATPFVVVRFIIPVFL